MRHVTLTVIRGDDTGELGLVVKDMPKFYGRYEAQVGDLIAHDLLEHQNGIRSIGSIDDELEALGGLWYVRGQHGCIRPQANHPPEVDIAADIALLGERYCEGVDMRTPVPVTRSTGETDCTFEFILEEAESRLRSEQDCRGYACSDREAEFLKQVIPYMRRGYSKAKRRFPDSYKAYNQFWAVARTVDKWDQDNAYEGQEYTLSYGNGEATMHERDMSPYDY